MQHEVFFAASFIVLMMEAFFSGSEMALIASDRLVLAKKAKDGDKGAALALEMLKHPEKILSMTLVGTNICITLQAALLSLYLYQQWSGTHELYATLILTPVVLIFGEMIPKTLAQRYAETLSPFLAPIVRLIQNIFWPATVGLSYYTRWISNKIGFIEEVFTGRKHHSRREELKYALSLSKNEMDLKSSEKKMIRRILEFTRSKVKDAMIPLVQVNMIEDSSTVEEAIQTVKKSAHSRMPVYHSRVDNIVGILHVYDLFKQLDKTRSVSELMKSAYYAPETQNLDELLFTMQKRSIHMAIVVDEYGGSAGIVTLEDILEEIVGDIKDEYDPDVALYQKISDTRYIIQARMEVDAINEVLKDTLKLEINKGQFETLGGFLLQQFNRIPEEGDELYFGKYKFTVLRATDKKIITVEVSMIDSE